jgi:hypothetical protein
MYVFVGLGSELTFHPTCKNSHPSQLQMGHRGHAIQTMIINPDTHNAGRRQLHLHGHMRYMKLHSGSPVTSPSSAPTNQNERHKRMNLFSPSCSHNPPPASNPQSTDRVYLQSMSSTGSPIQSNSPIPPTPTINPFRTLTSEQIVIFMRSVTSGSF